MRQNMKVFPQHRDLLKLDLNKDCIKFKYMNENLYGMFDKVLQSEYSL